MRISDWSAAKFLSVGVFLIAFCMAAFAYLNYRLDPLGAFGTAHPNGISIYHSDERFSKYMLAMHYIPEHFDSLLIGGSNSDNFPVEQTSSSDQRMYNASLNGGNLQELLPLVERATREGRVKTIYFCLDPYHTKNAEYKTGIRMEKVEREAWGSITLLKVYAYARGGFSGNPKARNSPSGVLEDWVYLKPREWWIDYEADDEKAKALQGYFIDPRTSGQLSELVELCRRRGIQLVVFLNVQPASLYREFTRDALTRYAETISNELGFPIPNPNDSQDPVIRLVLDNNASFRDGDHLTKEAAATLWPALFQWVKEQRLS